MTLLERYFRRFHAGPAQDVPGGKHCVACGTHMTVFSAYPPPPWLQPRTIDDFSNIREQLKG